MIEPRYAPSVVVGIDGSDAAINAAKWAVDEAIARDVPLRLVHAVPIADPHSGPSADLGLEIEYAETALRVADAAILGTGKSVKVETAVVHGSPDGVLLDESRVAAMVCVGSVGIGRIARMLLGSTAATLANEACCPAAIIRTHTATTPDAGCIAVAVDDAPGNDAVVEHGFREASLRRAPLIAVGVPWWGLDENFDDWLDRRLSGWIDRYPDVEVQPLTAPDGVAEFVAGSEQPIQLTVIGSADARRIVRFVGPVRGASILDHAECSVLVIRH
jgi:nucleotide-binding universal stress UspA family protein